MALAYIAEAWQDRKGRRGQGGKAKARITVRARAAVDAWLQQRPGIYRRIVIPKEIKWEIRDKLGQANISERVLFPGLGGLATWLKRHYSPK